MEMTKLYLENGIQVVAQSNEGNNVVSFGFWFNFGSAYESPEENGITHFLEHILNRQMFVQLVENI